MDVLCNTTVLHLNQNLHLIPPFIDHVNASLLMDVCNEFKTEAKYSQPMVFIGVYIAVASFVCHSLMALDWIFGITMKNFWFPPLAFPLNAASITMIAVAIKVPMDLSSPMPTMVEQFTKLAALGFLSTMMSHIMSSLGSMNNKSLFANLTALSILVITLIVNVSIQLHTGVIFGHHFIATACIYMCMLFFLLIILISSSITIPSLKEVLESKYQDNLPDQISQENLIPTVKELRQLVKKYWIMAQSSSPQFMIASTPFSSASSMIAAATLAMHVFLVCYTKDVKERSASVYGVSVLYMFASQTCGIITNSAALLLRCFSVLKFKLHNQNKNQLSVFKVEKYWTKKMCEWKDVHLSFYLNCPDYLHIWKNRILTIFIGFQKAIVVSCKIIELIPVGVIIFAKLIPYCFKRVLKARLCTAPIASSNDDTNEDLSKYVLLLEDDLPLAKYFVKISLASLDDVIKKAQQKKHNNLLELIKKSNIAFDGVETFDNDQIPSLLPVELVNSWSLPIISLTCIAVTIPGIDKDAVDNLFKSVSEGIFCTHILEESLNRELSTYVNIRKATKTLWHEVKNYRWLGNTLRRSAYEGKTASDVIKHFAHIAEELVNEFNRSTNGELVRQENLPLKLIAANSMYRVAQTIMHMYESNNLEMVKDELFTRLSVMIADILAACLTSIPKVILMKCKESAIEKREFGVRDAINLLQMTSRIIRRLETRELPNMDKEKMAFIDEWRLHLRQP